MTNTLTKEADALFIRSIENLGSGELAQLRRAAGDRLGDRAELLWFAGKTRSPRTEAVDFLVATLLAQFSTANIRAGRHSGKGDFGRTWRTAIGRNPSESIERRFHILLDSDLTDHGGGDLPFRMRQMIRYVASRNDRIRSCGVDWVQLLRDLDRWRSPDKWVQKKWARTFFSIDQDSTDTDAIKP